MFKNMRPHVRHVSYRLALRQLLLASTHDNLLYILLIFHGAQSLLVLDYERFVGGRLAGPDP